MEEMERVEAHSVAPHDVTTLVPADASQSGVLRPVASPEEVLAAWAQFQELKRSLLTLDDYQEIQGRARIKKSGWRKIAAAFGISDQLLREERRECEGPGPNQRYFVWEVTVRAIAPNGRYADAVGSCASSERRFAHPDHDVRAVAHTRAKNRAVADLVGGGEVSAEELEGELALQATVNRPEPQAPASAAPAPAGVAGALATEGQLRAIRAHLRRTGIDEARACARVGAARLEALTRRQASELIGLLAREPNAA
ncbi:MAG: hypothetical protein IRZ14_00370 [Chloroflexi bacterium]|nr:hypothetical protein [Chloroflexota bacterium]